ILGARRRDAGADELLDLPIGGGHDVDDARLGGRDLDPPSAALRRELPRLECDRAGQVEEFGAHAPSLARAARTRARRDAALTRPRSGRPAAPPRATTAPRARRSRLAPPRGVPTRRRSCTLRLATPSAPTETPPA